MLTNTKDKEKEIKNHSNWLFTIENTYILFVTCYLRLSTKSKVFNRFISQVFVTKTHVFCIFVVVSGEGHKLESFGTYAAFCPLFKVVSSQPVKMQRTVSRAVYTTRE